MEGQAGGEHREGRERDGERAARLGGDDGGHGGEGGEDGHVALAGKLHPQEHGEDTEGLAGGDEGKIRGTAEGEGGLGGDGGGYRQSPAGLRRPCHAVGAVVLQGGGNNDCLACGGYRVADDMADKEAQAKINVGNGYR